MVFSAPAWRPGRRADTIRRANARTRSPNDEVGNRRALADARRQRAMTPPASFAGRVLFEPIAALLAEFAAPALPGAERLSELLRRVAPDAASGGGRPIRFVPPPPGDPAYEAHIFATGEVPTRHDDWHDFFNALAWCVWPRAKTACNTLHLQEQARRRDAGLAGRGPLRDALTQLDECGVVVVSADAEIPALLAAHEWETVFWRERARLAATTRFLVFGHGTWDQLRQPFFGLCAKALYRVVDAAWLALPEKAQQRETDAWLAAHLVARASDLAPRNLSPLPLMGIPGVTPDNAAADYYRDTRQFRPRRPTSDGACRRP